MTRIWNPYTFTPLGNPIVGEAPPTLRVLGGMQATAQQLSYAQQRFTQFVMQARLSVVPNPTEAGRLPDGTQYRIVKVGPQSTMEIWPGGSSPAWDGAGVGVSVLLGGQRYLFLLTFVNNTWKVTRPKEFFGGDGLWVPANKQPYYLTFNAQQSHEGFFPSKDSEFQVPPTPVPPNASKCRAVAYTNGGELSGATVAGTRYVGVGRPNVLGNAASLTLYRTNAVSASAIKGTPFVAAADATESVSLGVVVGVAPENMALHPNSRPRASLTGNGAKAEFALVDRQFTIGGLLIHTDLGLFQNPVTKVVTASLPDGPLTVEDIAFDARKKCRQILSVEQLGSLYTNAANEPALLKGGVDFAIDFFAYPVMPAAPDISYDAGAVYLAQMYRTTTAFELSDETEATAFRWIGVDGTQKTARLNTDHKVTIKTVTDQYSSGSSGGAIGAITPDGLGVAVGPTTIGFDIVAPFPIERPSTENSYTALPADPATEPPITIYTGWGGTTYGGAIPNIPLGFYTETAKVREDRMKDTMSMHSSELVLREHDVVVEFSVRDTVVAYDRYLGVTMERSRRCKYSAEIRNQETVYMIPELGIIACMEARVEAVYDGEPTGDAVHVFNYDVFRSFVVFHKNAEIFRSEPVKTTLSGAIRMFDAPFSMGSYSPPPYELGDIAASWTPSTGRGTLRWHKIYGLRDDGVWPNVRYFEYQGVDSVTAEANGGILREVSSDREVPMPADIGDSTFQAHPGAVTHSLAHALDPNSGGGVVFVFAGTHPNPQNKQPLAGWAFSPAGGVTPISELLSQFEGHPLAPTARIEAVISV